MKNIILTSLVTVLIGICNAQITEAEVKSMIKNASEKELVIHSSQFLQENFYHFADLVTSRLLEISPENPNYNYRKGFILIAKEENPKEAIKYLSKCTKKIQKNFDAYSKSEDAVPTDVFFHLGRAYHLDEKIDLAVENYSKFIELSHPKSELIADAKIRLAQCEVARKLMKSPNKNAPKNLGQNINSTFSENRAIISLDGKKLFVSSGRPWSNNSNDNSKDVFFYNYKNDVYSSTKLTDVSWSTLLKYPFNSAEINEDASFVSNDERLIFLNNESSGKGDIFSTNFSNNQFQTLKSLGFSGINTTNRWESDYTESIDGTLRFFVSDKMGKKRDLYFSELVNGNWSEPQNLTQINTESDEVSPFISFDNKRLFFSSNSKESMGGFDLFVSERNENGEWQTPKNLGFPINSVGEDYSFSQNASGTHSVFISTRKESMGKQDVFEITESNSVVNSAFLNGKILSQKNKEIPENTYVSVKCLNCADNTEKQLFARVTDGYFGMKLEKCKEYELTYFYDSSTKNPYREKFTTKCDNAFEEINKTVLLIEDSKVIVPLNKYSFTLSVIDKISSSRLSNVDLLIKENGVSKTYTTNSNGEITFNLNENIVFGDDLNVEVSVSDQKYEKVNFSIAKKLAYEQNLRETISILSLKRIDSTSIFYAFDEDNITPYSNKKLNKILNYLKSNPSSRVEIRSYADERGSDTYNNDLSQRRAEKSRELLISNGINPEQVYFYKGFGEVQISNQMLKTEKSFQKFRRTDFLILN